VSDRDGGASREMSRATDPGDGRNVDPGIGMLGGEAAGQRTPPDRARQEGAAPFDVWAEPPAGDGVRRHDPTYYDRPVLKRPVWKWYVPAYLYTGGAAGAAALLGAVAQVLDRDGLDDLVRACRWIAAGGSALGTAFLVLDLGRPGRFLNMVRVFRPTSPMNVGSWILATVAPAAAGSALLSGGDGAAGAVGDVAGMLAGAAGVPLSGYTAVLLSNTAIPVWQEARRVLPPLFVASAATGAASILDLLPLGPSARRVARRFGIAGRAAELAAGLALEEAVRSVERVELPLTEGLSGRMWKGAKLLTAASLLASALPRRWRAGRALAGVLGTAGSILLRFAVVQAGTASAADPRATFHLQRAGHGGAEATGLPATTGPSGSRP
jgi:formate-dependent nitrite reductase membrane component NrfD